MILAEALAERADAQRRLAALKERLSRVARIQEGETPDEDPAALLAEAEEVLDRLTWLIRKINATNSATAFDEQHSLSDALALRDAAAARRRLYSELAEAASARQDRYSRSEVRFVAAVDVAATQAKADAAAQRFRELDTAIQKLNWQVELTE
ncbi:DIP1984 family protein [Corynebacterium uberis]|uniref:DIP1984 family protein n=1 Tax=Corynebacterium TaxID=1716 RepID=UPI001D0A2C69|nr:MULTISPECIES: DIP1984 family protein [Corynebacterium]MCZ9309320.1 DIP1984 family protein [Corynebacterium sp. c6VSa_13]UDL72871.1 DIP1984 family protein [Corynebacterium uberis]UDL76252.1 DIP1984 family protein [Corynebacterium uberis]UDL78464.1 DIP1984 family protein [Corynebacterium uberis]UDL80747.1 DIP1984 family protein [Corynebacterium uberis]